MDFEPTETRRMLRDSLSRYLADRYPINHRNAVAYTAPFHCPERWQELVDIGALHALVPEDQGGFGGSGFDITTLFESLGNALCPEPFLGQAMASRILRDDDLGALLAGELRYAIAGEGPGNDCTAVKQGHNWLLTGRKSVVYGGGLADRIIVPAQFGKDVSLFMIATGHAKVTNYGMIDGGNAADLFLSDTPARLLMHNAGDILRDANDIGALALCAEAVGAMDASAAMLLEYLKTRKQFGRSIGDFQVLQHRMVDLMTEIEQSRSITILAASRVGEDSQSRVVSMAKSLVGRTATLVAEEVIQMHGGIAMTWEHPASHYAKRLVMIDHQLGDTDHHLNRVATDYRA